jgi:uncharacterized protein YjeT (DUF2065 family)
MWQDLMAAGALVLVLEGVLPFLNPERYRTLMTQLLTLDNRQLRLCGLGSMLAGVLALYLVR